jgi:hypothetical protein
VSALVIDIDEDGQQIYGDDVDTAIAGDADTGYSVTLGTELELV